MGRTLWNYLQAFAAATLPWLVLGCATVPAPISPDPSCAEARQPATRPALQDEVSLSGALDGPTLRLALRDLAIILDTLGRLEQIRPELKTQMLAELADANAATAAVVVKRWRTKLAELQASASSVRTASAETIAARPPAAEVTVAVSPQPAASSDAGTQPVPAIAAHSASTQRRPAGTGPDQGKAIAASPISGAAPVLVLDSATQGPANEPPSWDQLVQSLVVETRERAQGTGQDAARARVQLALLEFVWQSEQSSPSRAAPDPELWCQLAPAIEFCLGTGTGSPNAPDETIKSLQFATELLRGPGRFQARELAFSNRVRGFGNIERVETAGFSPGQAVLLYSEVEHFFSEPVPGGIRTRISSTLELLDSSGRAVWRQEFAAVEDQSAEPRRDYFLSHSFRLPTNLKPGLYSVRLTLRDELANRSTSSGIALSIR